MNAFEQFPENARLWLYQADRALTPTEIDWLSGGLRGFVKEWAAHGSKLWADGAILNPYFVAFAVDESVTPPSGCSIDASVKFLKAAGQELGIDFFTRLKVCLDCAGTIEQIDFTEFQSRTLTGEEVIYDALIDRLKELHHWPKKLKESSLSALVPAN
jgi:hypothetical protein